MTNTDREVTENAARFLGYTPHHWVSSSESAGGTFYVITSPKGEIEGFNPLDTWADAYHLMEQGRLQVLRSGDRWVATSKGPHGDKVIGGSEDLSRALVYCASNAYLRRVQPHTPAPHPDDIAIDKFAAKMKKRMKEMREKGKGGWETGIGLAPFFRRGVIKNLIENDPVDAANYLMMLDSRDGSTWEPI